LKKRLFVDWAAELLIWSRKFLAFWVAKIGTKIWTENLLIFEAKFLIFGQEISLIPNFQFLLPNVEAAKKN
jgi:hypothetical protein